jgi:PREDICTED: similar to CG9890-PA
MDVLEKVLEIQEKERQDENFSRNCLFCKKSFFGNRKTLLDHLYVVHNFSIGLPDNLVFVHEFLDLLESKLNKRICLFCEKIFKDWSALKEHMRKKRHKQLNPNNPDYDKYYIVNYRDFDLDSNRNYSFEKEENNCDESWDDWVKQENDANIICLFCPLAVESMDQVQDHLLNAHQFDFKIITQLPFYKKVKLINYIRKSVAESRCYLCHRVVENLTDHFKLNSCFKSPNENIYDVDEFYIPLIENDALLQNLTDEEDFHE